MSPLRKIVFILFIATALALGVWAYFGLKNNKKPGVDALSLLPDSCMIYLRTNNFPELNKKLNSRNLIVDRLRIFGDVDRFCTAISLFDSLFTTVPLLHKELEKATLHFAVYGPETDWLAAFNISQLGIQEEIRDRMVTVFSAQPSKDGIYTFSLRNSPDLYFSISSGVVVLSNSGKIISSIEDKQVPRLIASKAFISFRNSTQENSLLSIYVDHKKYIGNELSSKLNLSAICSDGFSAGDIGLQPSEVKVNGFLQPGADDVLGALSREEAQNTDFTNFLPLNTTSFKAFGFSNYLRLIENADSTWKKEKPTSFWQQVNDSALYNLRDEFYSNISGCLFEFETSAGQRFVAAQIGDTLKAISHLRWMCDSTLNLNGDSALRLRIQKGQEGEALFLPVFSDGLHYVCVRQGYLFFAKNVGDMAQLQSYLRNEMLLIKDKSFANYTEQNFPGAFNFLIYASPNQNHETVRSFFNFSTSSKKDPFENLKHFSFSLRNEDDRLRFRWHLLHETEANNETGNSLWTLKLDTSASQKAGQFVNHLSGEKELLIQDDAGQLYLINAKGVVLWKKKIGETINSPLFTVDIFRNNKLQILFSTKNHLHLLDRNGNYVEGYPVKLPAEASGPLSVFDYDNNRDYRLFISCKNNSIFNYHISGKKQEGFNTVRTDNEVTLPIQYVRVGLSDYLVALDKEGKIYTFSRRGDGRIGLKNKAVANCNAFYVDATGNVNSTYFVYVDDKNGLISKVSFADKKEIVKLNFDVENAEEVFERVDENETMDLVFTRLSEVMAYDLNGNLLLKKELPNDLSESHVYRDQNRFVLLCYSKFRNELLVIDQIRQKIRSLPATAPALVCGLFSDGKKYLLVTNGKTLSCAAVD